MITPAHKVGGGILVDAQEEQQQASADTKGCNDLDFGIGADGHQGQCTSRRARSAYK